MRSAGKRRDWEQREKRERRGEDAFIFDPTLTRCFGMVPRAQWEGVIAVCSGNVAKAAAYSGLTDVPELARALWGTSKEDAIQMYQEWQVAKASGIPPKPREKRPPRRNDRRGPPGGRPRR